MTMIRFSPFNGIIPKADPGMLPQAAAQIAQNCRFSAGQLEAFRPPSATIYSPITPVTKTIYRFGQTSSNEAQHWWTFSGEVDVVKIALANDATERTFYTGDGYPKMTWAALATGAGQMPAGSYRLGLAAPTVAAVQTAIGGTPLANATAETRIYTYTYVDNFGWESAPAPESQDITVTPGQTVTLNISGVPSGQYYANTGTKRIYRSADGEYLFVAEVPIATASFTDDVLAADLGEVIPSLDNDVLPDAAKGLTAMPNGIMAAHTQYDVYFSKAFQPYAYPESYIQTVDYPIVGMACFGTSLAVLTTGVPYIMSGTDPSSISVEKLSVAYACLSKASICAALGGVLYAAADGLVSIDYSGPKVLTDAYFTRQEWASFNPSSMRVCVWDERIFMFYDNGTKGCLILDQVNGLTTSTVHATATFTDPVTGSLFLCVNNKIVKWDGGLTAGTYLWRSRRETLPQPKNLCLGQVLANTYPVTMRVYADSVLKHTQTVADDVPFRLPAGFRARYWEIELEGSGRVLAASLADSSQELQNV